MIKQDSLFTDAEWFIYNILSSKHCPTAIKDPRVLKYVYTLPELLELREFIDMMEASETAAHKDAEEESKMQQAQKR